MQYKIEYTPSFVIFWGSALSFGLFAGGLLTFALVSMMILVLISHERAHLNQCLKRGVKVNSVTFTAMGGMVDADILYANDAVPILAAGVVDTGCYAFIFGGTLAALYLIRPAGFNFAMNPWLNLLTSVTAFLVVMCITNVLPNYWVLHRRFGAGNLAEHPLNQTHSFFRVYLLSFKIHTTTL